MKLTDDDAKQVELVQMNGNERESILAYALLRLNTPEPTDAVDWRERALAAEKELGELKREISREEAILRGMGRYIIAARLSALISQKESPNGK